MTMRHACTLWEFIQAVTDAAHNDEEVGATVAYLIK
jgi:hypothetical protein